MGSIITLTNGAGTSVAEQSFDAYGRNRNPNNWTYNNIPVPPVWLYRGYTGHEELDKFGLINMNGRLYDPVVGRMLSPDNNVTDESNCQNYNRYSYVLNNPLKYIDPTGEDWDDYDDGYDGSVPPEHHVEDGILYQDVYYLGDHGMEHYSIPVGSEVSTGSNESGYEETLMEDMYESTYEENEREEVLDTKEEDGIKPTGTIYIDESIPDDLLEQIVIIPEDVDNDPLIYVDEPGKYKGDGIFLNILAMINIGIKYQAVAPLPFLLTLKRKSLISNLIRVNFGEEYLNYLTNPIFMDLLILTTQDQMIYETLLKNNLLYEIN